MKGTILPKSLEEKYYSLIALAVPDEERNSTALYAYNQEYQTYVVFRLTLGKEYHAYPVESAAVPPKIKRYFFSSPFITCHSKLHKINKFSSRHFYHLTDFCLVK